MIKNPSASRNQGPILEFLKTVLDTETPNLKLLEVSSGTGQHISYFSSRFPNIQFHPSEYNVAMLDSIRAYRDKFQAQNVLDPVHIDITLPYSDWGLNADGERFADLAKQYDYVLNVNMIHITPIECTEGLFRNSAKLLKPGTGLLITYGPYAVDGVISPESNVNFDKMLKSQDPRWGVRDLGMLKKLGQLFGLSCIDVYDMPANNKCIVWKNQ